MIIAFDENKNNMYESKHIIETDDEVASIKKINKVEDRIDINLFGKPFQVVPNKHIIWVFNNPNPWTQIVYTYGHSFPFKFFIKVKIPTLNDYEAWKQIIPNLDFDSKTGELMIPTKDEASALAVANLIVSNFMGQLSMENIIQKNLIAISINKAKQYDMVKNKLKEQIMEAIHGKSQSNNSDYEQDLAKKAHNVIKEDEKFSNIEPDAYEGGEYTYL